MSISRKRFFCRYSPINNGSRSKNRFGFQGNVIKVKRACCSPPPPVKMAAKPWAHKFVALSECIDHPLIRFRSAGGQEVALMGVSCREGCKQTDSVPAAHQHALSRPLCRTSVPFVSSSVPRTRGKFCRGALLRRY